MAVRVLAGGAEDQLRGLSGWLIIATCEEFLISMMWACGMWLAIKRSRSVPIAGVAYAGAATLVPSAPATWARDVTPSFGKTR